MPEMPRMINELRKLPELVETSDLSQGNFYYMLVDGKHTGGAMSATISTISCRISSINTRIRNT